MKKHLVQVQKHSSHTASLGQWQPLPLQDGRTPCWVGNRFKDSASSHHRQQNLSAPRSCLFYVSFPLCFPDAASRSLERTAAGPRNLVIIFETMGDEISQLPKEWNFKSGNRRIAISWQNSRIEYLREELRHSRKIRMRRSPKRVAQDWPHCFLIALAASHVRGAHRESKAFHNVPLKSVEIN